MQVTTSVLCAPNAWTQITTTSTIGDIRLRFGEVHLTEATAPPTSPAGETPVCEVLSAPGSKAYYSLANGVKIYAWGAGNAPSAIDISPSSGVDRILGGDAPGTIKIVAGTVDQIQEGYKLCNGEGETSNGVPIPDLTNYFVVSKKGSKSSSTCFSLCYVIKV